MFRLTAFSFFSLLILLQVVSLPCLAEGEHLSRMAGLPAPVLPIARRTPAQVPNTSSTQAAAALPADLIQASNQVLNAICTAFATNDPRVKEKVKAVILAFCGRTGIANSNKVITLSLIQELVNHPQSALGLSKIQRASIALDTLNNLASPTANIDQVGKTCIYAAYEVRVATLYPELYASLIVQVCLTGEFRCTDGSMMIYPRNSVSNVETARKSNWASRLFQVSTANMAWQSMTVRPDDLSAEKGSLRFELVGKDEGVKDYSLGNGSRLSVFSYGGYKVNSPFTDRKQEKLVNKLLTGEDDITYINRVYKGRALPGSFNYSDYPQLQKFLQYTAEGKLPGVRFPLSISIDGDRLQKGANAKDIPHVREGNHVATIMGYDPATQKVDLNNTWGEEDDFVGTKALTFQALCQYLPRAEN